MRSGQLLATAFHPELTDDLRWCALTPQYFHLKACFHYRLSSLRAKETKEAVNAQVTRRHALFVDMVRRRLAEQGDGGLAKRRQCEQRAVIELALQHAVRSQPLGRPACLLPRHTLLIRQCISVEHIF